MTVAVGGEGESSLDKVVITAVVLSFCGISDADMILLMGHDKHGLRSNQANQLCTN